MADLLKKLYYDPATGYIGQQKLYQKAKALDDSITRKVVKDWYAKQTDIQRFQEQKVQYPEFKIVSDNPNSWQIDLMFQTNPSKVVLTAININSRIGYAKILRSKAAATVLTALKAFTKAHKVDIITSDNGSEFMNARVQAFFKTSEIDHYNNEPGDHGTMGKIERFNRTVKQRLVKMGSKLTAKLLSDVISNYNDTVHRSIGMTPNEAKGSVIKNELKHNQETMTTLENALVIGSNVLYRLKKKQFGKESVRWSKAVYSIVGIDGYRVQIKSKNGHVLYKSPNDIKAVSAQTSDAKPEKNQIFEAERILEHKKMRNGKYSYLVQWTTQEPSWEPQDNLRLIQKNKQSTLEKEYWTKRS